MSLFTVMMALLPREEDQRAFKHLYLTNKEAFFWEARNILRDNQLAEDVVHEAFLKIINNFEKIMGLEYPKRQRYIVNIVKNQAIDEYRKRNRQEYVSLDEVEFAVTEDMVKEEDRESMSGLMSCIDELPVKYQDLFRLKYIAEKSSDEIAEALEISVDTLYKRLHRGKVLLMKKLKHKGVTVQ